MSRRGSKPPGANMSAICSRSSAICENAGKKTCWSGAAIRANGKRITVVASVPVPGSAAGDGAPAASWSFSSILARVILIDFDSPDWRAGGLLVGDPLGDRVLDQLTRVVADVVAARITVAAAVARLVVADLHPVRDLALDAVAPGGLGLVVGLERLDALARAEVQLLEVGLVVVGLPQRRVVDGTVRLRNRVVQRPVVDERGERCIVDADAAGVEAAGTAIEAVSFAGFFATSTRPEPWATSSAVLTWIEYHSCALSVLSCVSRKTCSTRKPAASARPHGSTSARWSTWCPPRVRQPRVRGRRGCHPAVPFPAADVAPAEGGETADPAAPAAEAVPLDRVDGAVLPDEFGEMFVDVEE